MNADLREDDVKQIKPWHYLAAMAASSLIPLTLTLHGKRYGTTEQTFYVGFPLVCIWVLKTFDLNPGRALARGKWVLLAGFAAALVRNVFGV